MATPHFAIAETYAADTEFFVRRGMVKGFEYASLVAPPAYIAFILTRRGRGHLFVNNILRSTWAGGLVGSAAGGAIEYARSKATKQADLQARRFTATYDTNSIRLDDHATIGSLLFALLTPAIFWKRAKTVNLVLGGIGIGSAAGVVTHHVRNLNGDKPPIASTPSELPVPSS
jgi:hypothetical protein